MTMLMMALLVSTIMVFTTSSMTKLFVMFEVSMIPTMIMITKWGDYPERATANMFMMMMTMAGSLPMMAMAVMMTNESKTNMKTMKKKMTKMDNLTWLCLSVMFLIKLPLFVLHFWLPKAHVQAPVTGSMLLAGVLLKLGGYGANVVMKVSKKKEMKMLTVISVSGCLFITISSLRQTDKKKVIAYSSVMHMMMMTANILSSSKFSEKSTTLSMVAHGLVSPMMFLQAGNTIAKQNSKNTTMTKSAKSTSQDNAAMFCLMALNMSAPPSLNFIMEVEMIMNIMKKKTSIIMTTAMLAMTVMSMGLATNMIHGNKKKKLAKKSTPQQTTTTMTIVLMAIMLMLATNKM